MVNKSSRYAKGTNVVLLSPDVAKHFGSSKAVNDALRKLMAADGRKAKNV